LSAFVWWRDGVVYQIYPRSFADSNGDGVGDLEGIRARLDHLEWLGVDAIWLSPIQRSPMKDFGYDVSDYCNVDALFGTLADFDRLLADAHARGIKLVLDWVPNHSSDKHPWFVESRVSRRSPKRDWYVWRDPGPDGGPPNNWYSIFGGGAWTWDAPTGQYYLHSFLREQPELNWRNPELVAAMHDTLRFWLDRGVDGFRIDVIHALAKDPELRSNPEIEGARPGRFGQRHDYDEDHPDVHAMVRAIRGVLDEYDDRMAVGEVYLLDPAAVARYYGKGDELHLAFNFSVMKTPWDADGFRETIGRFEGLLPEANGWPTLVLSSHDEPRHASRYDHPDLGDARARLAAMLLLTLRGTPFLYYGEEIGMRNVEIPPDRLRDPIGLNIHPKVSRDPERTPMLWDRSPNAGFSRVEPWLPLGPDAGRRSVEAQREDPASLLHLYRDLLALRRATPALCQGSYRGLEAPPGVFAFERGHGAQRVRVALNFGDRPQHWSGGAGTVQGGLCTAFGTPLPPTPEVDLGPAEGVALVVSPQGG
jgi:alpha-glucosidase